MRSLAFILTVVIPLCAAPLVYLIGRMYCRRQRPDQPCIAGHWMGILALVATWVPFIISIQEYFQAGALRFRYYLVSMHMDGLGLLLAAVVLTLATIVMLYSGPYMAGEEHEEKYYASLLLMTGAMIGLGYAADLFNLWLWFETMAVASFLLVAFYREQGTALEAGIKYMIQSATGSALVLFGVALVLAQTATLDLLKVSQHATQYSPHLLAAGALFVIGFGVKAALVPLHTWLPDAHSQAPSGISALLSGVMIEAGLVAMLRAITALTGVSDQWGLLLMLFAALNMLAGNLLALRQTQVKRMLAFSSLSHVGYMLLGLGISLYAGGISGAQGSLFHLINHGLMKGLAFLAAGALLYSLHLALGSHKPLLISDLAGAAQRYPLAALTLSLALLGLGGLPPLAGFMSKWQIFLAGFETGDPWVMGLVVFAALNSVLSLAYYAPVVNLMYRGKPAETVLNGKATPLAMNIPLAALAVAIIVIGIFPGLLDWLTQPAGQAVLLAMGR